MQPINPQPSDRLYTHLHLHRYGASALAAAASSGSHLSPFANSFSLLYSNSSLVSIAYSAFGANHPTTISPQTSPPSQTPQYERKRQRKLTFDNRIHRTALLAEPTVDALRHVDVIARRAPAAVLALLGFDGDGRGGADGFAQLARDAALLARGVAAQGVLAAEAGRDGAFFEGVVDCVSRRYVSQPLPISIQCPPGAVAPLLAVAV